MKYVLAWGYMVCWIISCHSEACEWCPSAQWSCLQAPSLLLPSQTWTHTFFPQPPQQNPEKFSSIISARTNRKFLCQRILLKYTPFNENLLELNSLPNDWSDYTQSIKTIDWEREREREREENEIEEEEEVEGEIWWISTGIPESARRVRTMQTQT